MLTMSTDTPLNLLEALGQDSYTARRLLHATPEHLYLTTRRCFIGPIPEGWLKSHRREWYKHHLSLSSSAKRVSFSAPSGTGNRRAITGLDQPQERRPRSFPQPVDLDVAPEDNEDGVEVTATEPPAIDVPRGEEQDADVLKGDDAEDITSGSVLQTDEADQASRNVQKQGRSTKVRKKDDESVVVPSSSPAKPAPSMRSSFRSALKPKTDRRPSAVSFVTAKEVLPTSSSYTPQSLPKHSFSQTDGQLDVPKFDESRASSSAIAAGSATSSTPLLEPEPEEEAIPEAERLHQHGILRKAKARVPKQQAEDENEDVADRRTSRVRFSNVMSTAQDKRRHLKGRFARVGSHKGNLDLQEGEAIKLEKMLVRVEFTKHEISDDFDENESRKVETTTLEKWKEFMVVCREATSDEAVEHLLQIHKTRVIKAVEKERKRSAYDIPLDSKKVKVSLFSSLDKTIVLCQPVKGGTRLYMMKPRCGANAMEWFTFLRNLLGFQRSSTLQVNVPDLSVHLKLDNPFANVESTQHLIKAGIAGDEEAVADALQAEEAAAEKIIARCMEMLETSKEYSSVVNTWASHAMSELDKTQTAQESQAQQILTGHQPVGLAWRRYDRIEWVHGTNEQKMYGTIGMERSHELEIRPKSHYPCTVKDKKGTTLVEPAAVEGFLVRLSSQKGEEQRFGKLFFKKLYFSTHSQFLVFNRPGTADPPPPPKLPMRTDNKIPTSHEIAEAIPLIFAVNPFPLESDGITHTWLSDKNPESLQTHDRDAADEHHRRTSLLIHSDGVINLVNVVKVRNLVHGATPADANLSEGSDVDFDESVDNEASRRDDGTTTDMDSARTFELVLSNGLVLRLQAYDRATKLEWMRRLSALAVYWRRRTAADAALLKSTRQRNLDILHIDEDAEALIGQYARKWEITASYAEPKLYHMCGVTSCRSVILSGILYRKARMHANFVRSLAVLTEGHLLIFRDAVRGIDGHVVKHIHHGKLQSLSLKDCYVYSGVVTEKDLLYSSEAVGDKSEFRGLPRVWEQDGWRGVDEESMTTFVIWHGKRSSWFKSVSEEGNLQDPGTKTSKRARLKKVSALGVEGRSAVFKCRSRAERDRWVMAVNAEIERLVTSEEVRVV